MAQKGICINEYCPKGKTKEEQIIESMWADKCTECGNDLQVINGPRERLQMSPEKKRKFKLLGLLSLGILIIVGLVFLSINIAHNIRGVKEPPDKDTSEFPIPPPIPPPEIAWESMTFDKLLRYWTSSQTPINDKIFSIKECLNYPTHQQDFRFKLELATLYYFLGENAGNSNYFDLAISNLRESSEVAKRNSQNSYFLEQVKIKRNNFFNNWNSYYSQQFDRIIND